MITIQSPRQIVHEFAAAVRAALSDLPADEVDELADGLEADLAEQVAESGDPDALGDPVAYADELRAAAGLSPRASTANATRAARASLRQWWTAMITAASGWMHTSPAGAWILDLLGVLRPVWWVIRGWAVYQVVTIVFSGRNMGPFPTWSQNPFWLFELILMLGLILLSIQWGRDRWLPWRWLKVLRSIGTGLTILALIPLFFATTEAIDAAYQPQDYSESAVGPGVLSNGSQVDNIFAYDASGHLLDNVRLYDQTGHPITTSTNPDARTLTVYTANGTTYTLIRNPLADGTTGWSVYPLTQNHGKPAHAPYSQVQPLAGQPSTTPSPTAAPSPTSGPPPTASH